MINKKRWRISRKGQGGRGGRNWLAALLAVAVLVIGARLAQPQQAAKQSPFAGTRFAVNGTYVLLTSDNSGATGEPGGAVAYYAKCPTGFSQDSPRYQVFPPKLAIGYLACEYRIVPQYSSGADVLVSYSLNTTDLTLDLTNTGPHEQQHLPAAIPRCPAPQHQGQGGAGHRPTLGTECQSAPSGPPSSQLSRPYGRRCGRRCGRRAE